MNYSGKPIRRGKVEAGCFADFVDVRDARVIERGGGSRFLLKRRIRS